MNHYSPDPERRGYSTDPSQSGSRGLLSSVPQPRVFRGRQTSRSAPSSVPQPWVSLLFVLILSTSSFAIGSGEKTPEEKAIIAEKSAVDHYNSGVKAMTKARETAIKGDSTFAFNYRATSDAKVKKHFEKAVREFEQAAKLDPKMKEALNNLGYCYRKLGKLTESLAAYDKAIGIDPNFAQAREYRGETYLAMSQLERAKTELQFLADMKSPYADSLSRAIELYELALISEKMGK